ncbi:MAG: cyclic nucleotide-binding domain-containing protein [Myxococcaceae bacterium]|nr:cyclic nucleotide-binding domain-containing protein [Myxococcaceae bacterium]
MSRLRWLSAAAFQALFIAAVALAKPAASAAVLSRLGAQALPWLYAAAALGTSAVALWAARRSASSWSTRTLSLVLVFLVLLAAAALEWGSAWAAVAAWVLAELSATQLALSFWAEQAEHFDAREAKSVFPRVNGIGMAGAIAGGLLAQLVHGPHTAPLLMAAAGAFLVAASRVVAPPALLTAPGAAVVAPWSEVTGRPYVRALGWAVLTLAVLGALADFVFRARSASALDEAQLASLFAWSQAATGLLCVGLQVLLTERLFRALGIVRALLLVPLVLTLAAASCVVSTGLEAPFVLKLLEGAATMSLLPVGFQLLYAPLPDGTRHATRQVVDGMVRKGGLAVAGFALLSVRGDGAGPWPPLLVVALGLVAAAVVRRLQPHYLAALEERVAGARATVDADEGLWVEALRAPSPERALRAVDLLSALAVPLRPHVATLLAHPHERVRERGARLAREQRATEVVGPLEQLLSDPARRPRVEACWSIAALSPARAPELLARLLDDGDVGVRCASIGALLGLDGRHPGALAALRRTLTGWQAAPVPTRREVARLLGRVPGHGGELARALEDEDPSVRQVAIHAIGEVRALELAPRLLRFLAQRDERRAAREALSALGDPVVPMLAMALDDRSRALGLRLQLPRVLRHLKTQRALDALLFSNARDDAALHYRVGLALARLREELPGAEIDRAQLEAALERRVEAHGLLGKALAALDGALDRRHLLLRVLRERQDQSTEIAFWLLGLAHDMRLMRRAHTHLLRGEPRERAYALELLENALTPRQLELARALLEPGVARGDRSFEGTVLALSTADDRTLSALARHEARTRGLSITQVEADVSQQTMQRLFALERVEIFARTGVDDLVALAALARERRFAAGERIYRAGDPGDALFVISEGAVEARRDGELVMALRAGEAFGDLSLLDGSPRLTDIVATEALTTLVIDRRDFLDLVADRPELLGGVLQALARQLKTVVVDLAQARRHTGETALAQP